jgi:hypothetical protein
MAICAIRNSCVRMNCADLRGSDRCPRRKMRIVASILSLAVLMWVEAASAQSTYLVSVSRHRDVPDLSESQVKAILARASRMLRKDSTHNDDDVSCDVTFTLKGQVGTFESPNTPVVDEDNIRAFHHVDSNVAGVDFHVKIVKEIKFCRPGLPAGSSAGCSFSPPDSRSMILVHPKLHKDVHGRVLSNYPDHLLWAHEFGHLTGLGHRDDDELALMTRCPLNTQFSNISDARVRVNARECPQLLAGPGAQPADPLPGNPACRRP